MTVRKYSSVSIDTTLAAGGISSTATSMTVAAGTGTTLMGGITLLAGDIFTVAIDPDTVNEEVVYITARSSDVFTITRAEAGTTGVVHAAGATVRHVLSSDDLNYFNQAIQSTTAPGFTPNISGGSASAISTQMQVRRDTSANWTSTNPTLAQGEIGFETNTGKFKIGTGSAVWTSIDYFGTDANVVTLTGTQTLTNKTIDASNNTLTGVVTLTGTQTLTNKTLTAPIINLALNAQTGTTYTVVSADNSKLVTLNNASAITVTIPNGVFTTGQQISFLQLGLGQVTFQGDGTSTIVSNPGVKTRAQYSIATIVCIATNTFLLTGDITA
jgi:hypothetical protein